ncbi:hypothetical protein BPOR_1218g00020 [Botrytis porri]|uniref:Uncharacterized protein n=1 Tax=Botrytis porri TaxID=87229 RepID=A0A4Z1K589_9HELO|nr:hypothetical protein BPOR_1218g00020 [Botrytis porri]
MTSSPLKVGLKSTVDGFPGDFQTIAINNNTGGRMEISFHRTIRIPDDGKNYQLPPDLGKLPIFSIDDYAEKLPVDIVRKGEHEALWIRFHAYGTSRFAVKVFVGGINAVSEESKHCEMVPVEPIAGSDGKQDYLVVPGQEWLDGIVGTNGTVMQFVVVPTRSGYSVEAQITGVDKIVGLQFEIIPFRVLPHFDGMIIIKTLWGSYAGQKRHTARSAASHIHGKKLEEYHTYEILVMKRDAKKMEKEEYDENYELELAPGGSIHQAIRRDYFHKDRYDEKNAVMLNVQFLAPKTFHLVTGTPPPQAPGSAETDARHGHPFFEMYNEPKAKTGTFGDLLKRMGDVDKEKNVNLEVHQRENGLHFRSVKLTTVDKMCRFYTASAVRKLNAQK